MLIIDCFGSVKKKSVLLMMMAQSSLMIEKLATSTLTTILFLINLSQISKNNCKNYLFYGKNRKNFKI